MIGRRVTHLREYSSRFRGPALSLYRHKDIYPSLGHASVTHTDMMGQCNQIGRDQSRVLCLLLYNDNTAQYVRYILPSGPATSSEATSEAATRQELETNLREV